jgi:hypothetical protein
VIWFDRMQRVVRWGLVGLTASTLAAAGCAASHECADVATLCEATTLTLQSPANAWAAGTYALALTIDGRAAQCTLAFSDAPTFTSFQGTCSASDVAWAMSPICPADPTVCQGNVCTGGASSANCLPGQFVMTVSLSPSIGLDAAANLPAAIAVKLSVDGTSLIDETAAPKSTTTEPNGQGCGTCTNGSATLSVAGG